MPIDPSYLSWRVKRQLGTSFRFVELANDVNEHMPNYVVLRITALLNGFRKAVNGSRILVFGLAYKKNSSDARESPAVKICELLLALGADVRAVDPHVVSLHSAVEIALAQRCTLEDIASADLAVILTDHDDFDYELIAKAALVLDTRHRRVVGAEVL